MMYQKETIAGIQVYTHSYIFYNVGYHDGHVITIVEKLFGVLNDKIRSTYNSRKIANHKTIRYIRFCGVHGYGPLLEYVWCVYTV